MPESINRKDLWILELREAGYKPMLEVILTTIDVNEAAELEIKYYDLYDNGELLCTNPRSSRYRKQDHWGESTATIDEESETFDIVLKLNRMSIFNLKIIAELD